MIDALPPIDPAYAAEVLANLPARLARKLDSQDPSTWTIEGNRIEVGQSTVTITGPTEAACDCLLAPKCLHLAAVLAACPVAASDSEAVEGLRQAAPPAPDGESDEPVTLSEAAREVVELATTTLDTILTVGLAGLATTDRARVLRVVALARVQALHRLGAEFATLHNRLRTPTAAATIDALAGAAITTWRLARADELGTVDPDDLGTARRRYRPVGGLSLWSLACEPVLTDSGYAGVVTHLAGADRRVWTLQNVTPGAVDDVKSAYRGSSGLPELSTTHAEIARGGLLLNGATASADGRLGRGKSIRASLRGTPDALPEADGWWIGPAIIRGLLDGPLGLRLVLDTDDGIRQVGFAPAVWQLDPDAVRLIAGCAGAEVEVRLHEDRLLAIAFATDDEADRPVLFPGLDVINRDAVGAHYRGAPQPLTDLIGVEPGDLVLRWRDRVAREGRRAVTGAGVPALHRDRDWLTAAASPTRANLLDRLGIAAAQGTRRFDGSFAPDPTAIRPIWTAVALSTR